MNSKNNECTIWKRWEHSLISDIMYENPYREVTVSVTYISPSGRTLKTYGFWDGDLTYKIRAAFSETGTWSWHTTCTDKNNKGLHNVTGTILVKEYCGENPLYAKGFIKVSLDKRYLCHEDETPFLWLGDTAWIAPLRASNGDWIRYIEDRKNKKFSVVQISPASEWGGVTDTEGNRPFTGADMSCWNPDYWKGFDEKVQYANEAGIVVMLVGLMEPVNRYPSVEAAIIFARNLTARMYGNFVILSPSFDSPYMELGDFVGMTVREATSLHLITQHPGTPSGNSTNVYAEPYYDKKYVDFCGNQTGHHGGNAEECMEAAINWNINLYNMETHKPLINLEAYYDANGTSADMDPKYQGTAFDSRSIGYTSWLSGSMGYTYGAYGLWNWEPDKAKPYSWEKALNFQSSFEMTYMYEFFHSIPWWQLKPSHHLIKNQSDEKGKKMTLAYSKDGQLMVAYLPCNDRIVIDSAALCNTVEITWFDPRNNKYIYLGERLLSGECLSIDAPGYGDWILLLKNKHKS